jgi:putative Mg2+ transporter-C (MgtC) family protein
MATEWELVGRTVVAALAGGLSGLDRQVLNKPAGIRAHMLGAAGSALFDFVAASILILGDAALVDGRGDAVRIPAAIVTGVGFLRAGAILRSGERVSGLTTAAGIWVTAAAGVLIGAVSPRNEPRRGRSAYRGPETSNRTSPTLGTRRAVAFALELDASGFGGDRDDVVPERGNVRGMVAVLGIVVGAVEHGDHREVPRSIGDPGIRSEPKLPENVDLTGEF